MKIWEFIKRSFMKASRFILNTDYATSQNDAEFTISVTIPSTYTVAAADIKKFSASKTISASASKDYRCYFTSTAFNYGLTGALEATLRYGSDDLFVTVERAKDKFTLVVYAPAKVSSHTYSGTSQVITAHIQTFVDPFQL